MIVFTQGSDFVQPFVAKDAEGDILNLTGATGPTFNLYPQPREGAVVALTLTATVTAATLGQFTVTFNDAATATLLGEYRYEVTVILASGDVVFLGAGSLLITESNVL